jgi:hypothetical protein
MRVHKVEVVLSENGTLMLEGLPFQAGEAVEVSILERPQPQPASNASSEFPLQETVLFYDDPFEPAVPSEEWNVLK